MKNIEINIDGRSNHSRSGITVILAYGETKWVRSLLINKCTTNVADMMALKLALLSITTPFLSTNIIIKTKNKYIVEMFNRINGRYIKDSMANVEEIQNVRSVLNRMKNVSIVMLDEKEAEFIKKFSVKAIEEQKLVDMKK